MIPAIRFQSMESMESEVLRCQRMTLRVKHYDNSGGACTNRDGKGKEEILMLRDGGCGHRGIGNISRNHKRDIIACFVFVNSEEARDVAAPYPSFGQARNGEMEPKSHHFDPQKSCGYLRDQLLVGGFQEQKNIAILKRKWPRAIRDHHTRKNEVNFRQSFHFGVFFQAKKTRESSRILGIKTPRHGSNGTIHRDPMGMGQIWYFGAEHRATPFWTLARHFDV